MKTIRKIMREKDADHVHDLQLGGLDEFWLLDKPVNRSLGAQVRHQLKGLPVGTKVTKVIVKGIP